MSMSRCWDSRAIIRVESPTCSVFILDEGQLALRRFGEAPPGIEWHDLIGDVRLPQEAFYLEAEWTGIGDAPSLAELVQSDRHHEEPRGALWRAASGLGGRRKGVQDGRGSHIRWPHARIIDIAVKFQCGRKVIKVLSALVFVS